MKNSVVSKVKLLFCIDWFYPSFKAGGPIKSIFNLATLLNGTHDVLILTSNQDIDGEVVRESSIEPHIMGELSVIYLGAKEQTFNNLKSIIKSYNPDFVHLNSLFSLNYTIKPLIISMTSGYKVILAPRGMLTEEALKIKRVKKKIFIFILKHFLNRNKVSFHVSTEIELRQVQHNLGDKSVIKIAQNLSAVPARRVVNKQIVNNEVKLVYISRVSSIKKLLYFLKVFVENKSSVLRFDIFGPIEDNEYWLLCLEYIKLDNRITYKGVLNPVQLKDTICNYHYFVLPTGNENFGHSIVEAIAYGVPVLISNRTPWVNLKQSNVGFDLPLESPKMWHDALNELIEIVEDQAQYSAIVECCFNYAEEYFFNDEIKNQNRKLFK